jgi:hypothetical protein
VEGRSCLPVAGRVRRQGDREHAKYAKYAECAEAECAGSTEVLEGHAEDAAGGEGTAWEDRTSTPGMCGVRSRARRACVCAIAPFVPFVPFVEGGFDEVYINQIGPEQEGSFDSYAQEVPPRLRAL